jgi:hypothetical protein
MALNPFALIAAGVAFLVVELVTAYKKFEWFRRQALTQCVNGVIGLFAAIVNSCNRRRLTSIVSAYNAFPLLPDLAINVSLGASTTVRWKTHTSCWAFRTLPRMAEGGIVSSAYIGADW